MDIMKQYVLMQQYETLTLTIPESMKYQASVAHNNGVDCAEYDNFIENGRMGSRTIEATRGINDVLIKFFNLGYRNTIMEK